MRRFRGYTALPRGVNAEARKAFQSTVTGAAGDGNRRRGSRIHQSPSHFAAPEAKRGDTGDTHGTRARRLTRSRAV